MQFNVRWITTNGIIIYVNCKIFSIRKDVIKRITRFI